MFYFELSFSDNESFAKWCRNVPSREYIGMFAYDVIPNDAEPCPSPGELFELTPTADDLSVRLRKEGVDPWHALWSFASSYEFGGEGRGVATDVPYQWESDEERLNILVKVDSGGVDNMTLSGRQANAYLESDDLPPLKEMKERLRAK